MKDKIENIENNKLEKEKAIDNAKYVESQIRAELMYADNGRDIEFQEELDIRSDTRYHCLVNYLVELMNNLLTKKYKAYVCSKNKNFDIITQTTQISSSNVFNIRQQISREFLSDSCGIPYWHDNKIETVINKFNSIFIKYVKYKHKEAMNDIDVYIL